MGLWRAEHGKLTSLTATGVGLESELEDDIESGPSIPGPRLMLIVRKVFTAHGGMSSGHQHIEWCRDEAIPLIAARATRPEMDVL
jgi:hypothetical protein